MTFRVPSPNDLPLAVRNAIDALRIYLEIEDRHAVAVTTAERDAYPQIAGLWVFNVDVNKFQGFDGTTWHNFH